MTITTADAILFVIMVIYFFLDKFLLPIKVETKLAQVKSDLSEKLEEIKSIHSKKQFIHTLQFKKEFDVYKELWGKLLDLKNSIENIHSPDKGDLKEKIIKARMAFDNAQNTIYKNAPFYFEQIFAGCRYFLDISLEQYLIYRSSESIASEKRDEMVKIEDEINTKITDIEYAIRDRIFK